MKNPWIAILLLGGFAVGGVSAQQESATAAETLTPPPIPPKAEVPIPRKIPSEQPDPTVRITEREGERVEEYSQNGRVYMVKITPVKGLPYYYMDEDGDGQLEIRDGDGKGAIRPVFWRIKEW